MPDKRSSIAQQADSHSARIGDRRDLSGSSVLVTGASSGIGLVIARTLAARGAAVAINHPSQHDAADALARSIIDAGGHAITVSGDVSREEDVERIFEQTVAAFGRVDTLVANAGLQKDAAVANMTVEDWQAVLDVDLTGQFLCCRSAIRRFRLQDPSKRPFRATGSIISISSVHDEIPWAGHANYCVAKGGTKALVRTLAQEVACDAIRVNAVAPGAIKTPINQEVWGDEKAYAKLIEGIPYARIGEPEDVAAAVAWLASDEADYITGVTLYVDGGMMLYPSFRDNG